MKKMLTIASLMILASCYSSNKPPYTQAEYDSIALNLNDKQDSVGQKMLSDYLKNRDTSLKRFSVEFENKWSDSLAYYKAKIDSVVSEKNRYYSSK